MSLSITDVHRIAHLARIQIDDGQAEEVRAKLDAIFALINQLAAVDTAGVEPMAHAQDVTLALRDDLVTESRPKRDLPAPRAVRCRRSVPRSEGDRVSERREVQARRARPRAIGAADNATVDQSAPSRGRD